MFAGKKVCSSQTCLHECTSTDEPNRTQREPNVIGWNLEVTRQKALARALCFKPHRVPKPWKPSLPKAATSICSMCSGSRGSRGSARTEINQAHLHLPQILPAHSHPPSTGPSAVSSKASLVAPATHFFDEPQTPKKALSAQPVSHHPPIHQDFCGLLTSVLRPDRPTIPLPVRPASAARHATPRAAPETDLRRPHSRPKQVRLSVSRASCTFPFPTGRDPLSPAHSRPQSNQDKEADSERGRGYLLARG